MRALIIVAVAMVPALASADNMASLQNELVGHAIHDFGETHKEEIDVIEESTAGKVGIVLWAAHTGEVSGSYKGVDIRYDNGDVTLSDSMTIIETQNVEVDLAGNLSLTDGTFGIGPGLQLTDNDKDGMYFTMTDVQLVRDDQKYSLNPVVILGRELFGKKTALDAVGVNLPIGIFSNLF